MDILANDELTTLVAAQTAGCSCVSLYLPTYRPGSADVQQNPVRLKRLIGQARDRLMTIGLRKTEVDAYLQPVQQLLDETAVWANTSDGLAVFLSPDRFRYYRLPIQFPELVVVANRFHVKPLLPLLGADGRFYVMAISQKAVRLLRCTRFGFEEMDIAGKIPRSMEEALQFDDAGWDSQFHAHHSVAGLGGAVITSHGAEVKETKDDLLRFFYLVDRGLQREFLHSETAPLIIVGVDYLHPIYRKANSYKYLLDNAVKGSPDRMTAADLQERGLKAAKPHFEKRQEDALLRFREMVGLGRTTSDLNRIVSESFFGKVDFLFVANNQQKWGKYDPSTNTVEIHSKEESCDVDMLDFVAANTLAHRGEVFVIDPGRIPDGAPAVAALRY